MKMIAAMIEPFMLDKVVSALEAIESFPGMTVFEVRGFGRRRSVDPAVRLQLDDFHDKTRLEIVAPDEMVHQITKELTRTAHTGKHGNGKIFVWNVEAAIRIQTDQRDEQAL